MSCLVSYNKKTLFIFLVFIALATSGCNSKSKKVNIEFDNYQYNVESNSYILSQEKTIDNPYDISYSQNKENIIYTSINNYDEPEVYLYNEINNTTKKLTDNIFIETNPVVNDEGIYAYIQSQYSTHTSDIYLNNKTIDNKKGLYKNLALNNKYLIYNYEQFSKNKHYICWLNLKSNKTYSYEFSGYIQKIEFLTEEKALVQFFSLNTMSMDVGIYDLENSLFELLRNTENDEVIKNVQFNKKYTLSSISSDQKNIKLAFNAYYNYYNKQLANPFSHSNNFMGRLTWNQSYRLENLVKLYTLTNNSVILQQIDYIIDSLLNGTNEKLGLIDTYNYKYSFSTKKYSLDKVTPISLMVNDAKVYSSITGAINTIGGKIKEKYKKKTITNLSGLYDYYNEYYDVQNSLYTFQYGTLFLFDGVWVPFNQQNAFGLLLLDLYELTGKEKYKIRVHSMARKFKNEFAYKDNKLLWHYWPSEFYSGWSIDDDISTHTPTRDISDDILYEDLSHAGINVTFILRFQELFPNDVFTSDDINLLGNTVDGFIYDAKFSRFMSGDIEYQSANYRHKPTFGWPLLKHKGLNDFYTSLAPYFYPDFDQQAWSGYLDAIDRQAIKGEVLNVLSETFNLNFALKKEATQTYKIENIHHYFESNM